MVFTYDNKIIGEPLHSFYEEKNFELTKKLREKNYVSPFNILKNFYLVRTFAINTYKLTSDYIQFIETEQFDEN
tara:strand:- start:224 stop:445 length:222 start_codon:yes stop_codon:yes gene_type:complete